VLLEAGAVAVVLVEEGLEAVAGELDEVLGALDDDAGGELDELLLELLGDEDAGLEGCVAVGVVVVSGSTYC
jgi:hypothetical protein